MRRVIAAFGICSLLVILPAFAAFAAEPPSAADDAALQKACAKLAADPFAGSGPREWQTPFQTIDSFQAIPVCKEALRRHPDNARLKLATAFAYIAGRKNDQATPLLDQLVAQNNSDAMLALASPQAMQRGTGFPDPRLDLANPNPYMPLTDCPWPR